MIDRNINKMEQMLLTLVRMPYHSGSVTSSHDDSISVEVESGETVEFYFDGGLQCIKVLPKETPVAEAPRYPKLTCHFAIAVINKVFDELVKKVYGSSPKEEGYRLYYIDGYSLLHVEHEETGERFIEWILSLDKLGLTGSETLDSLADIVLAAYRNGNFNDEIQA